MNQNEMQTPIRLNRYLASCGLGSRRACDAIIAGGRIFVNGVRVTELGIKVIPGSDVVEHLGRTLAPVSTFRYLAYHKPQGVIVTKSDPEGRTTIFDAIREAGASAEGLNYIGRLDVASEGLLLLTNDGSLIHALTHPRYHIKKVYDVRIDKKPQDSDIAHMTGVGVESEGQILRAGSIRDNGSEGLFWCRVELYEGKKRQIRRMFEALGYTIIRLRRVQFASVKLDDLPVGAVRELSSREVAALRAAGFPHEHGR
jgi:pseudouridine synthase